MPLAELHRNLEKCQIDPLKGLGSMPDHTTRWLRHGRRQGEFWEHTAGWRGARSAASTHVLCFVVVFPARRPFRAVGSAAGCATRRPAQSFPVDGKPACGPLGSAAGRALIRPQPTGRGGYAPSGRRRAATSTRAGCGCGWASPAQVRADGCPSGLDQRVSLGHAAAWAGRRQRQVRCGCVERNRDERRGQARFGYAAATRVGQGRRSLALVRAFGSQLRRAARRVHSPAGA